MTDVTQHNHPSVCVLILNYQSYSDTIRYVRNLQDQRDVSLHIIVIDNCSPNESWHILQRELKNSGSVEVIKSKRNGGYAYGNNFGLKFILTRDYDYVLISNNDVYLDDSSLISKLVFEHKQLHDVAFVAPVMTSHGRISPAAALKMPTLADDLLGSLRLLNFLSQRSYRVKLNCGVMAVDCLPGSFFLGEKNTFFTIGLFDENTFLYMEEAILAHKALRLGLRNYLITSASYDHSESKTISSILSQNAMRKHLIDSRIYFHRCYLRTGIFGLAAIKSLSYLWKIENFLYNCLRRLLLR